MKKILFLLLFVKASVSLADCPMADLYKGKNEMLEWRSYQNCANEKNDAQSQFFIGLTYLNGNKNIPQNLNLALKFFRIAAENGYAPAQRELSKLMDILNDLGENGKQAIAEMDKQWERENGYVMSALSWMMLAAEKAENKWFYFSPAIMDEEAIKLLPQIKAKYSQEEAQNASLAATQWKQEQLKKQARSLLTEKAYKQFENIIYPSQIEPPKMSREQAVEELKKLKISKSKLSKSK